MERPFRPLGLGLVVARLDLEREARVAELGQGLRQLLALLQGLAVPALLVLDERDALALERARHDPERLDDLRRARERRP